MFWIISTSIVAALMAIGMIFFRLKVAESPTSTKRIILPPIFMSSGAFMFLIPAFRVPFTQVIEALLVGVLFSILLIKFSIFEIKDGEIYLIPSKAFAFILFGLLFVRIVIKIIIGSHISLGETSGMFFLLAFGMIISWRLAMLYKYKKLEKRLKIES
ncbi:MAG TPA: cytochrome c biogenesis protein CcdC [Candidatus Avamphibacillus intestinigallinarum]|nr:cytochrome c biogenesis protein CcdC [Candidatus Avamphibacillus intestinigallinarum]